MSSSDDCNQAAIHSYVRVVLEWDTAWEYFGAVGMASNMNAAMRSMNDGGCLRLLHLLRDMWGHKKHLTPFG